jgi:hypothetical protein
MCVLVCMAYMCVCACVCCVSSFARLCAFGCHLCLAMNAGALFVWWGPNKVPRNRNIHAHDGMHAFVCQISQGLSSCMYAKWHRYTPHARR